MPKLKLDSKSGKLTDELGKELSDLEIVNLKEILTEMAKASNIVDKDAVFNEILKDKFNLAPEALNNINEIANKVRTEEKQKLYAELETQKKNAKTAEEKAALLEKQQQETQKLLDEALKDGKGGKKDTEEVKALKEQMATLAKEKEEATKNFDTFRTEINQKLETERLITYKAQQIALAGGKIIPELVSGNTQDEINLSIEKAKQRFAEIVQATGGNLEGKKDDKGGNGTGGNGGGNSTAINSRMTINQGGLKKEFSAKEIAGMNSEEYAAYRKSFLSEAGKLHLQKA